MLIASVITLPLVVVASRVGVDSGGLWTHLRTTVLGEYVKNTLWLGLGVAAITSVVGVATAWLVSSCRFPGRAFFRWALLLPLAVPTYLSAYAYTDLFQYSGPVQTWMRDVSGGSAWLPEVRSLPGAIGILSFALFPYVHLAARAAFVEQSICVLEVARTLGRGPWRAFFSVALPLARPSILAGLALVLMETLAEFGAVDYCAVDTFATGIYRTLTLPDANAMTAAAQLSTVLLLPIAALIACERFSHRARYHPTTVRHRELPSWRLRGFKALAATTMCTMPVLAGFVVPVVVFVSATLAIGWDPRGGELFLEMAQRTVLLAVLAALVSLVLAGVVASVRRGNPSTVNRVLTRLAGVGYAIPGVVIGLGVLVPLVWLDHRLDQIAEHLFGDGTGLLLSGSVVALVLGYQTRFLALSLNLVRTSLDRIQPTVDAAARTLGATALRTSTRVHLPMIRGSLVAAAILVFAEVVKELPATLLLRPFDFDTLAVRVYQLASDERLAEASSGALTLILVGLVPVAILARRIEAARPGGSKKRLTLDPSHPK